MNELTLQLDNRDEAVRLFGPRDRFLREVRDGLGVQLVARGDTIVVKGGDEQLAQAERVFVQLRQMLHHQGSLSTENVRTVLEVVRQGGDRLDTAPTPAEKPSLSSAPGRSPVKPRTDGQARYVRAMKEHDLTLCVGPAGTGKCVAADTLVPTAEGLVRIADLAGDMPPETYRPRRTEVFGVHGPAVASHVYNGGIRPTRRVRTRHGFALEGTPEHPVLTLGHDGYCQWLPLDEVRPGTFLAVARGTGLFGTTTAVNFRYERKPNDWCSRPVVLEHLDPEFAYFMGLLTGDGCLRVADRILFSSADDELLAAFEKTISRWGLHSFSSFHRAYDTIVCSRQLRELLTHLGMPPVLAHQKEVPPSVLRAPREIVVAFLQGLFDTDGTVDARDGHPSLATSSPSLVRQVHLLLLNLGVVAHVREKATARRPCYILDIRGRDASRFVETVGFRLSRKAERIVHRDYNTNVDLLPHVASLIDAAVRDHRLSRHVHKEFYDYRIGRRTPSHEKLSALLTHLSGTNAAVEQLQWLVRHQFFWSEVTAVDHSEAQVYDLTVPGDHSFVAGGIVNHNTYLAVGMAVSLLRAGTVKKIVLVRPAVEAGERLGFLPGDLVAKVNPYLRPLFDALNDMMDHEAVKRYMESDIIEIVPLAYMRGRTLNNAVIILDEGQNTTVPQMKMFLTRMGEASKIIVTGDVTQVDLPKQTRSGLMDAVHRLRDVDGIALVYLDENDIVRHPLVQRVLRAYEEERPRRKKE